MKTIRISNQVYKEIATRGKFGETPNDVLEHVFKIEKEPTFHKTRKVASLPPDGTECRFNHKREYVYGKIENGELVIPSIGAYPSLSKAASEITGTSRNGWRCWELRLPSSNDWLLADDWRNESQITQRTSTENTKLPWSVAVRNAIRRYCDKHHTQVFRLQNFTKEELDNIIKDTKTKGKTPSYTLQYYLQKLRDKDYIEFVDNQGTYRLRH